MKFRLAVLSVSRQELSCVLFVFKFYAKRIINNYVVCRERFAHIEKKIMFLRNEVDQMFSNTITKVY